MQMATTIGSAWPGSTASVIHCFEGNPLRPQRVASRYPSYRLVGPLPGTPMEKPGALTPSSSPAQRP